MLFTMSKYPVFICFLLITSIFLFTGNLEAKDSTDSGLTVIGNGDIINQNKAAARSDAVSDALIKGMEKYLEQTLGRQGMFTNFQTIIDDILPNYSEYIENFNILAETGYRNQHKVLVSVKINEKLIENKLKNLGIIIAEGVPVRLLFLVSQQFLPDEKPVYWWSNPFDNSRMYETELTLHRLYQERGFRPVNRLSSISEEYDEGMTRMLLTKEDILKWGLLYSADAIIYGRVEALDDGSLQVELDIITAENGDSIGRYSETTTFADVPLNDEDLFDSHQKQVKELEDILFKAVNEMSVDIISAFREDESTRNSLIIEFTGLESFRDLTTFNDFLVNDIRGVRSLLQTRIKDSTLTLSADFNGTPDIFVSRLRESLDLPFPAIIDIDETGTIKIEIRKGDSNDNP